MQAETTEAVAGQAEVERDLSQLPVLLPDVPHDVYHSDPWGPSLSQSTANLLLSCPKKAWAAHPRLGYVKIKAPSEAMDTGSLIHELLLGKGAGYVSVPFDDWRTNAAKEAREEIREAGLVPVLARRLEETKAAAEAIRESPEFPFAEPDGTELTILWKEGAVLCRARLDAWEQHAHGVDVYDLKIKQRADPALFQRNCKADGYDIQAAAYTAAVEALLPRFAGRVRFTFVLCEPEPPYVVQCVRLAGSMRSLGQQRWKRAIKLWQKCLTSGTWPGYCEGVADIEALPWQLQDDFAQAVKAQGDPTEAWGEEAGDGGAGA